MESMQNDKTTQGQLEQEMEQALDVLKNAHHEALVEALISASGTLRNVAAGQIFTGPEMERWATCMAAQFVQDNQTAAAEAEALSTIDPARATIN